MPINFYFIGLMAGKEKGIMITLDQAKGLRYGQELYHVTLKNADGKSPMRFRVAGAVKTRKRDETRIRVPIKRGLYETGYLTNGNWEGGRNWNLSLTDVKLPQD